jgi:hypothetical protein
MTCKRTEYQPVIIMGRDESGNRIELQFPTESHARWARPYWRLFEAFNPHLPDAEEVSDSEIGPLLIELVEANKIDSLPLKEALREIVKGEYTDSL